ncbi:uncharacterized protein [Macrobrachium rosenbergii]|uniref:uncharacterized protein n=1 Tax=Macrobrachium rosenbergii TaxID=79674 RepID=UPI0034D6957C
MDGDMRNGRVREGYRGIGKIKNGYQARSRIAKNVNGSITVQKNKELEIWKNYFCELLNRDDPINPVEGRHMQAPDLIVEEPTLIDVKNVINSLKHNTAPGLNNIPAELLKNGGEMLHSKILELLIKIWRTEEKPTTWETGNIIPVHKKGDKSDCANYRGITLLPTCYKVLAKIIKDKLEPYTETALGKDQCCFRKGRSTIDQIFTIRQKIMRSIEEVEGWVILRDANAKVLAFADDVDFLCTDIQNIERLYIPFKETAARVGLEISGSKTKVMRLSRNNQQHQQQQNMGDIENNVPPAHRRGHKMDKQTRARSQTLAVQHSVKTMNTLTTTPIAGQRP